MIKVQNLQKIYQKGEQRVHALKGVSVEIHKGDFVSVMGPSGSGKSTFLHLLGGLDAPSSGEINFNNVNITRMSDSQLTHFRRKNIGIVFQFFNLLPSLTALENVILPLMADGKSFRKEKDRATELLKAVGLVDRLHHRPDQLSGGEMQRTAIARALIADPLLILADEPTGNLDSQNGEAILNLLSEIVKKRGSTVIMVTHDKKAASFGTRQIRFKDGLLDSDQG